jgi:hypothetical protein
VGWRERNRPIGCANFFYFGRKHGHYRYYRHPHTTQERRLWDEEFGRNRRSPRCLPEAYDDIIRTVQRSWKEHRRSQYK